MQREHALAEVKVQSDMNAQVWKIEVAVGDRVRAGDALVILEAMKQELPIEAPVAGTVSQILVAEQTLVEDGQVLVVLEA